MHVPTYRQRYSISRIKGWEDFEYAMPKEIVLSLALCVVNVQKM
jgi:hypothetical protein